MCNYIWCEDSKSGFEFWTEIFSTLYPEFIVETKGSNSRLCQAAKKVNDDGNTYFIILDTAIDNPDVLRENIHLKNIVRKKDNIKYIKIHSFELALLSFQYLEEWVFAENDFLKEKRSDILEMKDLFVKIITENGDNAIEWSRFKEIYSEFEAKNTEKIAATLLEKITKNTGFETNKKSLGPCFIKDCCEWSKRQSDDICGLDNHRLSADEKKKQIVKYSILMNAFKEAGL